MSVEAAMIFTLFVTTPSPTERVAVVDASIEAARDRYALRLVSQEERFVLGGDIDDEVRRCGSDVACVASRVRSIRTDLVALALVNTAVAPPLVDVQLVDVDTRAAIFREAKSVPRAEIAATVRLLLDRAFDRANHPKSARLAITATPADALVLVTPSTPAPARPGDPVVVAPGTYVVNVSKEGFVSQSRDIALAPGERRDVALALRETPGILESPWFWGTVAAVVVAGVVTAAVVLDDSAECFCVRRPGVECPSTCN